MTEDRIKPWHKPRPAGAPRTKLTAQEIERARARALEAGRPYPNLVDNMWVLRQRGGRGEPSASAQ